MPTTGTLELTIKINEFPTEVQTVENGWKQFDIDCDGQIVTVTVKPKVFKVLVQLQKPYPMCSSELSGKMEMATQKEFTLEQPNVQVFEKKPKEPKPENESKYQEPAKQNHAIR